MLNIINYKLFFKNLIKNFFLTFFIIFKKLKKKNFITFKILYLKMLKKIDKKSFLPTIEVKHNRGLSENENENYNFVNNSKRKTKDFTEEVNFILSLIKQKTLNILLMKNIIKENYLMI